MKVSTRTAQINVLRQAERDLTAMFRDMQRGIAGILTTAAGEDGTVPFERHEQVRADVARLVEGHFVRREHVFGAERDAERDHLQDLIGRAQRELRKAKGRSRTRIMGRLMMLTGRLATLQRDSVRLVSITDDTRGQSPYGRILTKHLEQAVRAPVERHATVMRHYLRNVPDVLAALERG